MELWFPTFFEGFQQPTLAILTAKAGWIANHQQPIAHSKRPVFGVQIFPRTLFFWGDEGRLHIIYIYIMVGSLGSSIN